MAWDCRAVCGYRREAARAGTGHEGREGIALLTGRYVSWEKLLDVKLTTIRAGMYMLQYSGGGQAQAACFQIMAVACANQSTPTPPPTWKQGDGQCVRAAGWNSFRCKSPRQSRGPKVRGVHKTKFDGFRTQIIIDPARVSIRKPADWAAKQCPIGLAAEVLRCTAAISLP